MYWRLSSLKSELAWRAILVVSGCVLASCMIYVTERPLNYVTLIDRDHLIVLDIAKPEFRREHRQLRLLNWRTGQQISKRTLGPEIRVGTGRSIDGCIVATEHLDESRWLLMLIDPISMRTVKQRVIQMHDTYMGPRVLMQFSTTGRWFMRIDGPNLCLTDARTLEDVDQITFSHRRGSTRNLSEPRISNDEVLIPAAHLLVEFSTGQLKTEQVEFDGFEPNWSVWDFDSQHFLIDGVKIPENTASLSDQEIEEYKAFGFPRMVHLLDRQRHHCVAWESDDPNRPHAFTGQYLLGLSVLTGSPYVTVLMDRNGSIVTEQPIALNSYLFVDPESAPTPIQFTVNNRIEILEHGDLEHSTRVNLDVIPRWSSTLVLLLCLGWCAITLPLATGGPGPFRFWPFSGTIAMLFVVSWCLLSQSNTYGSVFEPVISLTTVALTYCGFAFSGIWLGASQGTLLSRSANTLILLALLGIMVPFYSLAELATDTPGFLFSVLLIAATARVASGVDPSVRFSPEPTHRRLSTWQASLRQWLLLTFAIAIAVTVHSRIQPMLDTHSWAQSALVVAMGLATASIAWIVFGKHWVRFVIAPLVFVPLIVAWWQQSPMLRNDVDRVWLIIATNAGLIVLSKVLVSLLKKVSSRLQ